MNKLLFLAPFPTNENIKDGMINRVHAIDSIVKDIERIYLDVSIFKYWRGKKSQSGKATVYNLNLFRNFFLINRLLKKATVIYSHSIHGFTYLWHMLPYLKSKIILDAHGVVPEEMKYFSHYKCRYFYYEFLEKKVVKRTSCIICVTDNMHKHFVSKYPRYNGQFHIYNIFPAHIKEPTISNKAQGIVYVIYSGGISPWQNVDLMLEVISRSISPRIKYTILTSDTAYIARRMQCFEIKPEDIELKSVMPNELSLFYEKADYAFILRSDNVVNRVACPTKLVEYLNYGIIPIVLSPFIGDFFEYGYEYLPYEYFNKDIEKPTKSSLINMNIVKKMEQNNSQINIRTLILS